MSLNQDGVDNLMGALLRHAKKYEQPVPYVVELEEEILDETEDSMEEVLNAKFRAKAVREAVARLPQDQQDAVKAIYLDGLTTDEATKKLKVSKDTITKRMARGLEQMRMDSVLREAVEED